ncbi:MAG: S-layer homology domain-containing protein [Oscillibacter sp.]|nr:S-layer homology domain-containing protein [Oscillibacter sp.]
MKKFISMALALVMTLSLYTFIAPEASAEFTDADQLSSKYAQQAADVIQTIEVMDGYDDGSFRPAAGLTRQAAAKIICNMVLGPTTAKALPTNANPFPDVLAGNQFSGYISYCSQKGIISGYSDGTFRPGDPLSGYAYLKMLLGALGYDSVKESFTGPNWKVNVAKLALGKGLNKGINENEPGERLDGQVTREDAATYAFNTLQGDMVEYASSNSIEVNGVKVNVGGGEAVPQTWNTSSTSANNINNETSDGANNRPIVQFAERYFDKLERFPKAWDTYTADAFGRPSIRWSWKGVDIDTYPEEPDVVYNHNVSANTIYTDLNMGSADPAAAFFLNGRNAGTINISRGNGDDIDSLSAITAGKIGDGTIVEAYHNDANNTVTVCVINVWAGKVTGHKAATTKKDECVVIDVGQYDENAGGPVIDAPLGINALSERREFESTDFEEDDVVWYTYSEADREIKDMGLLERVEGSLTRRYADKSVVLGSDTYPYAKNVVFSLNNGQDSLANKSEYIVYLNDEGQVMWIEESDFSVDQYALIERIWIENTAATRTLSSIMANGVVTDAPDTLAVSYPRAVLRLPSGVQRTVTLNESKAYRNDSTDSIGANYKAGKIIRFSITSDNTYRLYSANTVNYVAPASSNSTLNGVTVDEMVKNNRIYGFTGVTADSNTRFVVNDNGTYKTYTGVRNAPDITGNTTGTPATAVTPVAFAYAKDGVAKVIYCVRCHSSNTSKDITFIAAPSVSKEVREDDTRAHYEYNAVVKNNITTILVASRDDNNNKFTFDMSATTAYPSTVEAGNDGKDKCVILNTTEYNGDDIMTSGSFTTGDVEAVRARGIKRVSGTLLELKLNTYQGRQEITMDVSDSVKVYFSDGDGNIEAIDMEDIVTDSNDWIYYTVDEGEITNLFIQQVDDDDGPTTGPVEYTDGYMTYDADGLNWVYHYYGSAPTQITVENALLNGLRSLGSNATVNNITNSSKTGNVYTFTIAGTNYHVTVSSDASVTNYVTAGTITAANASIALPDSATSLAVVRGSEVRFVVQVSGTALDGSNANTVTVRARYTDVDGLPQTATVTAPAVGSTTWTLVTPNNARPGSTIYIDVT